MDLFADALSTCSRLFRLNLSSANVVYSTIEHLAAVFDKFPYLIDLDLSHNALDSKSAQLIAKLLIGTKTLERLNLSHNKLSDKGIELLSTALKKHTTLVELDLADNQINTSLKAISEMLKSNRSLVALNLNQNGLSDIKALLDVLKVNPVLSRLSLNHNPIKIGLSSLFKALAKNRSLTHIEIVLQNTPDIAKTKSLLEALKTNFTLTHIVIACDDVTKAKIASSLLRNAQCRDELHQAAKWVT